MISLGHAAAVASLEAGPAGRVAAPGGGRFGAGAELLAVLGSGAGGLRAVALRHAVRALLSRTEALATPRWSASSTGAAAAAARAVRVSSAPSRGLREAHVTILGRPARASRGLGAAAAPGGLGWRGGSLAVTSCVIGRQPSPTGARGLFGGGGGGGRRSSNRATSSLDAGTPPSGSRRQRRRAPDVVARTPFNAGAPPPGTGTGRRRWAPGVVTSLEGRRAPDCLGPLALRGEHQPGLSGAEDSGTEAARGRMHEGGVVTSV